MINHKPSIKRYSHSSLLASVALLLGGALSLSSAVQAQETIISLGIGSELGYNDPDGPKAHNNASATAPLYVEHTAARTSNFAASVHIQNGKANNEFHFSYLYGEGEATSDPDAAPWAAWPRGYIVLTPPFAGVANGAVIYNNARRVIRAETGLSFEYRSYYTTELASRGGATFTAYGGFGVSTNYFNANTVYETSGGSTFAETNETEFAIRATPMLGTTLQYGFKNGHYLKTDLNMNGGGVGYVHIENDVVKGNHAIIETHKHSLFSDRSGLDAYSSSTNQTVAVVYGTHLFEFTAGNKVFLAANDLKNHMYFEIGVKF